MSAAPSLPELHLTDVLNDTPFEHFACDKMGAGRAYFDTLVVKGTFTIKQEARAELADQQAPIVFSDELWNPSDSERSGLRCAGEVVLMKPSTDVIVTGHAHAPNGVPAKDWDTSVEVRGRDLEVLSSAHVLGPNWWRHSTWDGWCLAEPEPIEKVAIRYDLAFGGGYQASGAREDEPGWVMWKDNPSGVGFYDVEGLDEKLEYPGPQWLLDSSHFARMNNVPLAGYGPVARPWTSRLQHAGTYDDKWLAKARKGIERGIPPDYARDFDPRFFQCAHPSLIMPRHLLGNEVIRLTGLMPGAERLTFQLPCVGLAATLTGPSGEEKVQLPLDTVHIDTDEATVSVCWRLTIPQRRNIVRAALELKGTP